MAQHATVNTPPNYAMPTGLRSPGLNSELPTYSPRRSPSTNTSWHSLREDRVKEFEYDIKNRGKTTATLTLLAEQSYSKHVPTFLQGSPVRGRVYLNADKVESVQLITVTVSIPPLPPVDSIFIRDTDTRKDHFWGRPHSTPDIPRSHSACLVCGGWPSFTRSRCQPSNHSHHSQLE